MLALLIIPLLCVGWVDACEDDQDLDRLTCRAPEPLDAGDTELDCARPFPTAAYNRALRGDRKMQKIIEELGRVPASKTSCDDVDDTTDTDDSGHPRSSVDSADHEEKKPHAWYSLCPTKTKYIWHWAINLGPPHGWCFILSLIRYTKCITKYCLWTGPWPFFRCVQENPYVYFWAFCPFSPEGPFVFTKKQFPQGCCCRRFWCHHHIEPNK